MQDGFIRVAAATPQVRVADCAFNAQQVVDMMRRAEELGCGVLVLPELCLTAYTCSDLFLQDTLLDGAQNALERVVKESAGTKLVTFVGLPFRAYGKLYNCAAAVFDGRVLGLVPKTHIPNYSEFYEARHFSPAPAENLTVTVCGCEVLLGTRQLFVCSGMKELIIGAEICEDLWVPAPPSQAQALAGATLLVNLSASDEVVLKDRYRRMLVASHSARLCAGYIYAAAGEGESTTDLVFSGHDLIAENGTVLAESKRFETGLIYSEIDISRLMYERRRLTTYPACDPTGYAHVYFDLYTRKTALSRPVSAFPFVPPESGEREHRCEEIFTMQALGLKKRISHSGARTAVVGVSGGLDSALALLIAVRAFDMLGRPRADVVAVTMPGFGTTGRTYENAVSLARLLGVTLREVNIGDAVRLHFKDIGHDENNFDVVYENCQARERTQVLMDIANQSGGLVVGTGDLSELALGWATYNGDHMSMYSVNVSIPKTLVRYLIAHEAEKSEDALRALLDDVLDTPVSPELLPAENGQIAQKTEDIVGPYELHDFFLYYVVRWSFAPAKIFRLAQIAFEGQYDKPVVLHWMKVFYSRFFSQQFKRSCLPDGPKVGSVTLSPRGDWRMPSDACAALWLDELEKI